MLIAHQRLLHVAGLVLLTAAAVRAESPRTDRYGDALPPGALLRLGNPPKQKCGVHLAFTPNGKLLAEATGTGDVSVLLWDVATGQRVRTLARPMNSYGRIAMTFSPDSKSLITAYLSVGGNSEVYVWEVATGERHSRFQFSAHAIDLSPDGRTLATGCTLAWNGNNQIYGVSLWDVDTGKKIRDLARGSLVQNLCFSTDGKVLAGLGSGDVPRRWNVATGKKLENGEGRAVPNQGWPMLSPDGKTAAAPKGAGVILYDMAAGIQLKNSPRGEKQLAFSVDGKIFASGARDGTIFLQDVASGKELHRLREEYYWYGSAAFSRDGKQFACATFDRPPRVWDLATCKQLPQFGGHLRPILYLAFSPDGKTVASISQSKNVIRLWDAATGIQRLVIDSPDGLFRFPAFSPNGKLLAAACGRRAVCVWDAVTGMAVRQFPGHNTWTAAVGFLPDGRLVTAGADRRQRPAKNPLLHGGLDGLTNSVGNNGTIRLWDVASGQQVGVREGISIGANMTRRDQQRPADADNYEPVDGGAYTAFSPNGRTFVSIALEGGMWIPGNATDFLVGGKYVLRAWDVERSRLRTVITITLESGRSSKENTTNFVIGGMSDVRFSNTVLGQMRYEFDTKGAICPSFTSDGKAFVLSADTEVTLRETAMGKQRQHLAWSRPEHYPAVIAPDGGTLAIATYEGDYTKGLVRLYDLGTGKEFGQLNCQQGTVSAISFSPDGRTLATGGGDGTILIWDYTRLRSRQK